MLPSEFYNAIRVLKIRMTSLPRGDDMYTRFVTIQETDRRTDKRTDRQTDRLPILISHVRMLARDKRNVSSDREGS